MRSNRNVVEKEGPAVGRNNKSYRKSLHQLAYEKLMGMQAFGQSKKEALGNGTEKDKIFSCNTYQTYWKHIKYFIKWIQEKYPDCTTLNTARHHVNEWLQSRVDQVDGKGQHLSAWTIQTEAAALNKLYQIDKADPDRFQPPKRNRSEIKRSRVTTARDANFSVTNNDELIKFCRGTGCRRGVLEKLEGRDLWTRKEMEDRASSLAARSDLSPKEAKHLTTLRDALAVFPDHDYFIHHRKDKNGRYRFAPIIGPEKYRIIERMRNTGATEKVWQHVSSNADIHGYRSEYATAIYKQYARKIEDIPYDRVNKGTGKKFQGDVYTCRKEEAGRKLDRAAMKKCSKALGHNRISVVADNYIRGL